MKVGKVSESVLKRTILKQITSNREEVLIGAGIGVDCAVLAFKEDELMVMSTDPITGSTKDIGILAVHATINDIASSGAEPVGVMLSILLPVRNSEAKLKRIMEQIVTTCDSLQVQVIGGHTEVTAAVNQPIVTVTGVGKMKRNAVLCYENIRPGQDLVLTKWIGLEGTSIVAKEKEEELLKKYPKALVDQAKEFDQYFSIVPEAAIARKFGVISMHDVTEGGVFGALWEVGESADIGLSVNLKKIPVKQETIEVCEMFDLNPYSLISSGALLIVTENGHDLVDEMVTEGIQAAVIGKIMDGKDRVVINDGERRFLEPPKSDELYKIYETSQI